MIQAKPVGKERCPRHALESAHFHNGSLLKGLHHSAQGCEPRATLGVRRVGANNPIERVASVVRGATCSRVMSRLERPGGDATLTGLGLLPVRLPRVARPSQPWAGRSNPFGIASWHAAPRLPDSRLCALGFGLG
jgi:hypothetical protein